MFPSFPRLVSRLPNLKYLNFSNLRSGYKCDSLPAEFLNSDTMTDLYLAGNCIPEIPRLQMPKLETLDLGNNKLRRDKNLYDNLAGLPSLETLDLTLNGITELPAAMPALPKLRLLILNDNAIGNVAANLSELYPSLERVEARGSDTAVFKRVVGDNVVVDCG
jgi:Leucine-rich repeat (LRR) protein